MNRCPICNTELHTRLCPGCGFDSSCNYLAHPTLAALPADLIARSRQSTQPLSEPGNILRCENCGCNMLMFLLKERHFQCPRCRQIMPLPEPSALPLSLADNPGRYICAGDQHTAVLRRDGTVLVLGKKTDYQSRSVWSGVSEWKDITTVAAGRSFVAGLRKDGTVALVGNPSLDKETRRWCGITKICASNFDLIGLTHNGTVISTDYNSNRSLSDWTDIVSIAAGNFHVLGIRKDGTVVAIGEQSYNRRRVENWTDIVSIAAGAFCSAGIRRDGSVVVCGDLLSSQGYIAAWRDIAAVSFRSNHMIGLKKDGTVLTTQPDSPVSTWRDIIAIDSSAYHIVGLRKDGTLVACGLNAQGQCDVDGIKI